MSAKGDLTNILKVILSVLLQLNGNFNYYVVLSNNCRSNLTYPNFILFLYGNW